MSNELLISLVGASNAHQKACCSRFAELGLTPGQPKVLSRLNYQEGYLQKELANLCGVEPATMTVLLNSMEKKNLIRKETSHVSGGKRAFRIYLTEEGKRLGEAVDKIVDEVEKKAFEGLSPAEREEMLTLLNRVTGNLT